MSFSLYSFSPTTVKNETMKYFEKRSADMHVLRYRCPNDDIFDPFLHLSSLKSVFLKPKNDYLLNSSEKSDMENVLINDLHALTITDSSMKNKTKPEQSNKKSRGTVKQTPSNLQAKLDININTSPDKSDQNDIYSMINYDYFLKIIRNIKEKDYISAFENIDKSVQIFSQYELGALKEYKKDLYGIITHTALFGLLLSYSIHDEEKQYKYLDIISDCPIIYNDLPHFYHLIDEMLVTNNGIKQLTLARLLGFPDHFFTSFIDGNQSKSKRSRNNRRSNSKKGDLFFYQNKKNNLNRNDPDYDNDSFNIDNIEDYSDNDYDYYDFESDDDNDIDDDNFDCCDDFDYNFFRSKHYRKALNMLGSDDLGKRTRKEIRRKMKKELFMKNPKFLEQKKLVDMKLKSSGLLEQYGLKSDPSRDIAKINSAKNNNSAYVSQLQNNNNDNDNDNDSDVPLWKTISNKNNYLDNQELDKNEVAEIQVVPLLNVVYKSYLSSFDDCQYLNKYLAYKVSHEDKVVNCNFIPEYKLRESADYDFNDYNLCCLSFFQQPQNIHYLQTKKNQKKSKTPTPKFTRIADSKEKIKSFIDSTFKVPIPILTCSLLPEDENDESLSFAIESAVTRPNLFSSSKPTSKLRSKTKSKTRIGFKPDQEIFGDFIQTIDNSCPIFKSIKSKVSSKNISISPIDESMPVLEPNEGGDINHIKCDDDCDRGIENIMDFIIKGNDDISVISHVSPVISINDDKLSRKINFIKTSGTKTTTEIKKTENGTTIAKITTTSNLKFHNSTTILKDNDTNNQSSRSQKNKKRKKSKS